MPLHLALIAIGFALLITGANVLVGGASIVARRFGMPDRVIGLTIVAVGTGLPEIMVSVTSAVDGHVDLALGNAIGSSMVNLLLILGLCAVVRPLRLSRRTQRFDIPAGVAATLVLLVLANLGGRLDTADGAIMIALFFLFMAHTVASGLREGDEAGGPDGAAETPDGTGGARRPDSLPRALLAILAGGALLKVGSEVTVDNATLLAVELGMSDSLIGLTVLALGTNLPELVTSVTAATKGNADLAVGNIIGSNITNVLLVTGIPALAVPIVPDPAINADLVMLALGTGLLVVCSLVGRRHVFSRPSGVAYVTLYACYVCLLLVR